MLSLLVVLLASHPALASRVSKASDQELLQMLDAGSSDERQDAIAEIADRRLRGVDSTLLDLVKTGDPGVRKRALAALDELKSGLLIEACVFVVQNDPDEGLRAKALAILEDDATDEVAGVVGQAAANDPAGGNRRKAVVIIGKRGWKSQEPVIVEALHDSDPKVVYEAWKALFRLNNPAHRALAYQALASDPDTKVRQTIARHLGEDPQPGDLAPLMAALDDPDLDVRVLAARSLARLGDRSAGPKLRAKANAATTEKEAAEFGEAAIALGS